MQTIVADMREFAIQLAFMLGRDVDDMLSEMSADTLAEWVVALKLEKS